MAEDDPPEGDPQGDAAPDPDGSDAAAGPRLGRGSEPISSDPISSAEHGEPGTAAAGPGGTPIAAAGAAAAGGAPIGPSPGVDGQSVQAPGEFAGGGAVGGPESLFHRGGAPIAVLGGVFSDGLPLGGPVSQIFRSSAPTPNILYLSTLTSSGPIGPAAIGSAGQPIAPREFGTGGVSIQAPPLFTGGTPVSGPESLFNIGGAPIAVLGGVFGDGLPIGGPVTQVFRGGSAPVPNTLFLSTLTPSGPIGNFLIGAQGGPIGALTFGGGGLPIGAPPAVFAAAAAIQPRTAAVGAAPQVGVPPPAVAFRQATTAGGAPAIGG